MKVNTFQKELLMHLKNHENTAEDEFDDLTRIIFAG